MAAPEAATCHSFLTFSVNPWTNEEVPRGSPYNHVADRTGPMDDIDDVAGCGMQENVVTWANKWSPCGPVMGCHMAA
jgi:hypothetical protein